MSNMKTPLLLISIFSCLFSFAQKREELMDYNFKPNQGWYYYVITEKDDSLWHRKAYYISEKSLALEAWYKDDSCTIPEGTFTTYHTTKFQKDVGHYRNGRKDGLWLNYTEDGHLHDSCVYVDGHRKGISYRWYDDGTIVDSSQFDGAGNGVEVSWHKNGAVSSAGYWVNDTARNGRWKYFYDNGNLIATEDYRAGKMIGCACYDEKGQKLDSADCVEKEAAPQGGAKAWRGFFEKNLQPVVEAMARSGYKPGQYTVSVRFLVNKDGSLDDLKAMTAYGNGLEEKILKMMKNAPKWTPGRYHGQAVRSYHTQPLTFVISK